MIPVFDRIENIVRKRENAGYNENGGKFSKKGRKRCGKRRNCSLRAFSPFPAVFSTDLYCRSTRKNQGLFGKALRFDCTEHEV